MADEPSKPFDEPLRIPDQAIAAPDAATRSAALDAELRRAPTPKTDAEGKTLRAMLGASARLHAEETGARASPIELAARPAVVQGMTGAERAAIKARYGDTGERFALMDEETEGRSERLLSAQAFQQKQQRDRDREANKRAARKQRGPLLNRPEVDEQIAAAQRQRLAANERRWSASPPPAGPWGDWRPEPEPAWPRHHDEPEAVPPDALNEPEPLAGQKPLPSIPDELDDPRDTPKPLAGNVATPPATAEHFGSAPPIDADFRARLKGTAEGAPLPMPEPGSAGRPEPVLAEPAAAAPPSGPPSPPKPPSAAAAPAGEPDGGLGESHLGEAARKLADAVEAEAERIRHATAAAEKAASPARGEASGPADADDGARPETEVQRRARRQALLRWRLDKLDERTEEAIEREEASPEERAKTDAARAVGKRKEKEVVEEKQREQDPDYDAKRQAEEERRAEVEARRAEARNRRDEKEARAALPPDQRAALEAVEDMEADEYKAEVERQRRAQDAAYDAQRTEEERRKAEAKKRRQDKEALAARPVDQRAALEAIGDMEEDAYKEEVEKQRRAQDPEYARKQQQAEQRRADAEARRAEVERRRQEKESRAALPAVDRASLDAREAMEAEEYKSQVELQRQMADPEYARKQQEAYDRKQRAEDKRRARETEEARRGGLSPEQRAQEDAEKAAQKAMDAASAGKAAEASRRAADPEYDRQRRGEERGAKARGAQQAIGGIGSKDPASMLGGAAKMVGGEAGLALAEAVPIAGAIVVGADLVKEKVAQFGQEMGEATSRVGEFAGSVAAGVAAFDTMGVARTLSDELAPAARKATMALGGPWADMLLGPTVQAGVKASTDAFWALERAVKSSAERLSTFHGGLAQQQAQEEMVNMMREMRRARLYGNQIQAAEAARFRLEQRLADAVERMIPLVMGIGEKLFATVDNAVGNLTGTMDGVGAAVGTLPPALNAALSSGLFGDGVGLFMDVANWWRGTQQDAAASLSGADNWLDQDFRRMQQTNRENTAAGVAPLNVGPGGMGMP